MNDMISEFKKFALRGNVIDLAVGLVIGGAFTAIIKSLVDHILMPILGVIVGKPSFDHIVLEIGDGVILLGMFFNAVVSFVLIALALFFIVKLINKMQKEEEAAPAAPPAPSKEEVLLTEIRDALRNK